MNNIPVIQPASQQAHTQARIKPAKPSFLSRFRERGWSNLWFIPYFYIFIYLPYIVTIFLTKYIIAGLLTTFFQEPLGRHFESLHGLSQSAMNDVIAARIWEVSLWPVVGPYRALEACHVGDIIELVVTLVFILAVVFSPAIIFYMLYLAMQKILHRK